MLNRFRTINCVAAIQLALALPLSRDALALPEVSIASPTQQNNISGTSPESRTEFRVFDKVVGWATAIAADRALSKVVVAVGSEGRVYRWNEEPWDWDEIGGPSDTTRVFVGNYTILRLSQDGALEEYKHRKGWEPRGTFELESAGRSLIVEVNPRGSIYVLPVDRESVQRWNGKTGKWETIGAPARHIVGSSTGVYAVAMERNEVWHYDERTGVWDLAFSFPESRIGPSEFNREVDMTVVRAETPQNSPEEDFWQSESVWIRCPQLMSQQEYQVFRYDRLTRSVSLPMYFNWSEDRFCQDQRGAEHLVSFAYQSLGRPSHNAPNPPVFETFAVLPDDSLDDIEDYADNGELPLILGESGNIYMESSRIAD